MNDKRFRNGNIEIKEAVKAANMRMWQLAEMLGVSQNTLCRRLRHELPDDEKKEILALIQNYGKGGENNA